MFVAENPLHHEQAKEQTAHPRGLSAIRAWATNLLWLEALVGLVGGAAAQTFSWLRASLAYSDGFSVWWPHVDDGRCRLPESSFRTVWQKRVPYVAWTTQRETYGNGSITPSKNSKTGRQTVDKQGKPV